jgi:hypothetical protein
MSTLPPDYFETVYSGALDKVLGVYLCRPFEGWTNQRILEELGPIKYFVQNRLNRPIVAADDDISGIFTFIRALEDMASRLISLPKPSANPGYRLESDFFY